MDRLPFDQPEDAPEFDGETYDHATDHIRLGKQCLRVCKVMADGAWHTYAEIGEITGDPATSISARLRDLRKKPFGGHTVERRRRGGPTSGLYEFRLIWNPDMPLPLEAEGTAF